jgi:hypothetical protein
MMNIGNQRGGCAILRTFYCTPPQVNSRAAGRDTRDAERILQLLEANLQNPREHKHALERDGLIAAE